LAPPEPILIRADTPAPKEEAKEEPKGEEIQAGEDSSAPPQEEWLKTQGDAVYRLGKPYKVNGVWYFPAENDRYDEIGYASWYGGEFHNKRTANGEIFDKNRLTGAHKTLPLPSIVRVTNIENSKSVILRVNDRGPFTSDRLIDVSEHAAKLLEFPDKGVTRVRVEILPEESRVAVRQTSRKKEVDALLSEKKTQVVEKLSQPQGKDAIIIAETIPDETPSPEEAKETVNLFDTSSVSPTEAVEPTPAVPVVSGNPVYIQVGIFRKQENAENTVKKVSSIGPAKSWLSDVGGKVLYRVQVGPFNDMGEAQKALSQVKEQGLPDAYVMKNQG
jgi:rare lipoprotein A